MNIAKVVNRLNKLGFDWDGVRIDDTEAEIFLDGKSFFIEVAANDGLIVREITRNAFSRGRIIESTVAAERLRGRIVGVRAVNWDRMVPAAAYGEQVGV